jgi:serine/threonine-protein kinase
MRECANARMRECANARRVLPHVEVRDAGERPNCCRKLSKSRRARAVQWTPGAMFDDATHAALLADDRSDERSSLAGDDAALGRRADEPLAPGEVVADRFVVRRRLGQGSAARVYEADDRVLRRRVALKVARSRAASEGLLREAHALAAIRHPGLVAVFDVVSHRGAAVAVLERVYGVTLAEELARRSEHEPSTRYSIEEVLETLDQLADALGAVHRAGLAHRDVTPANVVRAADGHLVLLDLGISRAEADQDHGGSSGTPLYMAPETIELDRHGDDQVVRAIEPARGPRRGERHLVDLYALGVIAFELLTGRPPFDGGTVAEVMRLHTHARAPELASLRADVPKDLSALVAQLLLKRPAARPASIEEVLRRLHRIRTGRPSVDEGLSVLVVDDDPSIGSLLRAAVMAAVPGSRVTLAGDATQAMAEVRRAAPDALLVDLDLPEITGLELCMSLRGARLARDTVFIAVSDTAREGDVQLLAQLGIERFVRKGPALVRDVIVALRDVERRTSRM